MKLTAMDADGAVAQTPYWTTFGYDGFNRLASTTYPGQGLEDQWTYDKDDNILSHTTRAGEVINFQYDALDRMATKTVPANANYAGDTVNWTYDLGGRVGDLSDSLNNDINPGYDTAGRVTSVSTKIPGLGTNKASYKIGGRGNRLQLKWPDGYLVNYTWDAVGRLTSATDGNGTVLATYQYDPLSHLQNITYANGASMAFDFTTAGDLLTLNHDMAGTGNDVHYTLGYTAAHEMNSETISKSKFEYDPPATGAGTDSYAGANKLNQYTTVTFAGGQPQTFQYDPNGNLSSDGPHTYGYDPENHLMVGSALSPSGQETYTYDPKGRRTGKSAPSTTYFLNDGDDEIAEYDGSGNLLRRYVPGATIDQPIAEVPATGSNEYFHIDHHGSVIAMSDSTGTLVEGPYLYDAYGNCETNCTGGEPFKFTGRRLDSESGLYYYRARYYSAQTGRFLQTDPVGYSADMDLYSYGENDPIDKTDPTGKCVEDACLGEGFFLVYVAIPATIATVGAIEALGSSEHKSGGALHNDSAPKAAAANDGTRAAPEGNKGETDTPHGSPEHDAAVNKEIQGMRDKGYGDIRKNQAQVDAKGNKVGNNRPDAQGTNPKTGQREHVEIDRSSQRGQQHEQEIKKNDPAAKCTLITLCK